MCPPGPSWSPRLAGRTSLPTVLFTGARGSCCLLGLVLGSSFDDDRGTDADEARQHGRCVDAGARPRGRADHLEQARTGLAGQRPTLTMMHRESVRSMRTTAAPIRASDPAKSSASSGVRESSVTTTLGRNRSSLPHLGQRAQSRYRRVADDRYRHRIERTPVEPHDPKPRTQLRGQPRIGHLVAAAAQCLHQTRDVSGRARSAAQHRPTSAGPRGSYATGTAVVGVRRSSAHRRSASPAQHMSPLTVSA